MIDEGVRGIFYWVAANILMFIVMAFVGLLIFTHGFEQPFPIY